MTEIRNLRKKLGLSARKFAKLIGSNTSSVYNWDNGRSTPRNKEIHERIKVLCELFDRLEKEPNYLIKLMRL